jgi:DNA-binding MarR family transcriptional regulator
LLRESQDPSSACIAIASGLFLWTFSIPALSRSLSRENVVRQNYTLHLLSGRRFCHSEDLLKPRPKKSSTASTSAKQCPWLNLSPNGTGLHIDQFITFRMTRLSNALRNNLSKRYLEEFGLSLPEWRLLALITRFSPVRFSELTSRSSMDKGQVSRTLRVMSKSGLIKMKVLKQRSRSAEALAAPVVVSVTAKGRSLYEAVLPVARRRQAEMLLNLSPTERVQLYGILDKLFSAVGNVASGVDEGASD